MYKDILEDSWVYQETKLEGKLDALHKTIINLVQAHFPEALEVVKRQIDGVKDENVLQNLIVQISFEKNTEDILQILLDLSKSKPAN